MNPGPLASQATALTTRSWLLGLHELNIDLQLPGRWAEPSSRGLHLPTSHVRFRAVVELATQKASRRSELDEKSDDDDADDAAGHETGPESQDKRKAGEVQVHVGKKSSASRVDDVGQMLHEEGSVLPN